MNRTAFGILILCISINFSIGICNLVMPHFEGYNATTQSPGILTYNETFNTGIASLQGTIKPTGVTSANQFSIFRILDMVGLGVVTNVITTIGNYVFALPNLLSTIFGPMFISGCSTGGTCDWKLYNILFGQPFGLFYIFMSLIYIFAAILMFTGKSPKAE